MHTVSTQFTHVGCSEPTSHIHPHIPMLIRIPHGTHTARHPIEILCTVIFQMTMVITHTTIQRPALPLLAHRGITTHVKQSVLRYQRLLTQILRLLPHAVHTGSHFPSVKLLRQIPHIIGHCMQLKKHLILIRTLLKLLPSVLLITHRRLQIALRQIQRVVPHRFVVLHLLKRQGLAVSLHSKLLTPHQLSCLLVAFTFHNTRRQMETRPSQMRVSPLLI